MTFLLAAVQLLLATNPDESATWRVCADTRAPPWTFVKGLDTSKETIRDPPRITQAQLQRVEGFDVDLMRALAVRLRRRSQIVPTSWFSSERALLEGRCDAIISAWTPGAGTLAGIAASIPYAEWGLLLVVAKSETTIRSIADLDGRRVAHYRDPAVSAALREMGRGSFSSFDDVETAFAEMKAGRLDAVFYDSLYVHWKLRTDSSFRVVGQPLNRLGYHVGVRSEDAATLERVDATIRELQASGELPALRRRWEGPPP